MLVGGGGEVVMVRPRQPPAGPMSPRSPTAPTACSRASQRMRPRGTACGWRWRENSALRLQANTGLPLLRTSPAGWVRGQAQSACRADYARSWNYSRRALRFRRFYSTSGKPGSSSKTLVQAVRASGTLPRSQAAEGTSAGEIRSLRLAENLCRLLSAVRIDRR